MAKNYLINDYRRNLSSKNKKYEQREIDRLKAENKFLRTQYVVSKDLIQMLRDEKNCPAWMKPYFDRFLKPQSKIN